MSNDNFKDFMLDEMHRRKVEKDIADLKKLIGKMILALEHLKNDDYL